MRRVSVGLLLVLSSTACGARPTVTADLEQPAEMNALVLERAPIGAAPTSAVAFLEAEGFTCMPRRDAAFLDREHIDYLYCDRSSGAPVARRWQVAIVERAGAVVEVLSSTGLIGP